MDMYRGTSKLRYILVFGTLWLLILALNGTLNSEKRLRASCSSARFLGDGSEVLNDWGTGTLPQDDPILLDYIREHFLIAPSSEAYRLWDPTGDPSWKEGQNTYPLRILKYKRGGFFVECGAWDGESLSTTLVLERDYGWTGLLAEPNRNSFAKLVKKNRKAWIANICLSTINCPQIVEFEEVQGFGGQESLSVIKGFSDEESAGMPRQVTNTSCFPIFSVLSALNVKTVDFFTLDIEGAELDVLKTIPFHKILIKIFAIEWNHVPEGKDALRRFVESKGYLMIDDINRGNARDYIFVHRSISLS